MDTASEGEPEAKDAVGATGILSSLFVLRVWARFGRCAGASFPHEADLFLEDAWDLAHDGSFGKSLGYPV